MIRVQLWRDDLLVVENICETQRGADSVIDQMINDMHTDKHGWGMFSIEADTLDSCGSFLGTYWRATGIYVPGEKSASEQHAVDSCAA